MKIVVVVVEWKVEPAQQCILIPQLTGNVEEDDDKRAGLMPERIAASRRLIQEYYIKASTGESVSETRGPYKWRSNSLDG